MSGVIQKVSLQLALVMIFSLALALVELKGQDTWYFHYELALEKIGAGRWEEAVGHLEHAAQLKPTPELNARTYGVWRRDYLPYYHLGLTHYNLGQDEKALKYFKLSLAEGAVMKSPEQLELLRNYQSAIEDKTGKTEEERALDLRISAELERGIELEQQGEFQEALVKFESVLTLDPGNEVAGEHLARIKMEIKRREDLAMKNAEIENRLAQGKSYLEQENYIDALTSFQKALALDPENEEALELRNRTEQLLEQTAEEQRQKQQRIAELLEKGTDFLRMGMLEEAQGQFEEILELDPENSEALRHRDRTARLIEEQERGDLQSTLLAEAARLLEHDSLITARDMLLGARQLGESLEADSLFALVEGRLSESEQLRRQRELPQLVINLPEDSLLRYREPLAVLSGTAVDEDGIVRISLSLNGKEHDIFSTESDVSPPVRHSFEKKLELSRGLNRISLVVYDGDQKISTAQRQIMYLPPFWRQPVFISLLMFLIIFSGGGYVYYKRTALHIMFNRVRRRPFELIAPNPFIVGNPIRTREMFFGREDDFRFVKNKVDNEKYGSLIVLFGERRAGKTSVLYQILGGRLGPNYLTVFIDMQAMAINDDSEFLGRMAEITLEALKPQKLDFDFSVFEGRTKNPYPLFEKFIDKVLSATGEDKVLLLIDEYELIEDKVVEGKIRKDIFLFLSGLVEHKAGLFLIFAGNHRLQDRDKKYWEPLLQRCDYRNICYLTPNDTRRLIQEPVRGKVFYLGSVIRNIMRLTAGQPFYTQLICRNIVEMLNAEKRNYFYEEDISPVVREILDNPPPQMIYFWAGLNSREKVTLSAIAEMSKNANQYTDLDDLAGVLKKFSILFSMDELKKVAEKMLNREILEQDTEESFRFRMDLFRLWIREEHNLYKVSREIKQQVTA
jgi:tetratricopeptide (TPR) repeat protein